MMLVTLLVFVPYTKGCVFYVGDFNYPHINWKIPSSHGSIAHNNFVTCTLQNGLTQVVDCPTHGANCIDLVFASNPCLIHDLAVSPVPVIIAQWTSQSFVLVYLNPTLVLVFETLDYPSLISYLLGVDWLLLYNNSLNGDEF